MSKRHRNAKAGASDDYHVPTQRHATREELYEMGKRLRDKCPRQSHAAWRRRAHRPDPLDLVLKANKGRIPELVPIRHGRMIQSPFTFFRGAALNMAADLADTPATGLRVQACGDCHLMNFGGFATPERRMVFDINDLDETLPAPWEWDVKRLAASFTLACRDNGFGQARAHEAATACVRSYRERMAEYSEMHVLDVWYASIGLEDVLALTKDEETRERVENRVEKARKRNVLEDDFPDLATGTGLKPMIRDNPPLIYHRREDDDEDQLEGIRRAFARYRDTLREDRRRLLDRFTMEDIALKVVGVGSVGTYCGIVLLMAGPDEPLFLQFKQARTSVLEAYVGKSRHANDGERIVHGYQMMQSASDMFLGWTEGRHGREFFVRQLRDMKIKPMIEVFKPSVMVEYAELCGWALAHAHARSGEPAKISGYLGKSDKFDEAIAEFANAYADQSERDHEVLLRAVRAGKLDVFIEEK